MSVIPISMIAHNGSENKEMQLKSVIMYLHSQEKEKESYSLISQNLIRVSSYFLKIFFKQPFERAWKQEEHWDFSI